MDEITKQTLQELTRLEADLKRCEQRLLKLGNARVPVYFSVPVHAQQAFRTLYAALGNMKDILQGKPSLEEG